MRKLLTILSLLFVANGITAQDFISSGKITYERRMNMWAELPETHFEQFKKMVPQYKNDLFTLTFTPSESLYKPEGTMTKLMIPIPASDNVVYTNFDAAKTISAKNIFDNNYLIEEALRNATWKIKDDIREIAGFNCRRATTVLFDSIFVVAFYTDQIIPSAGPESFNGLPGAILGLVINRLHITWYATRVEAMPVGPDKLTPPTKGSKTTMPALEGKLGQLIKNFGSQGERLLWLVKI